MLVLVAKFQCLSFLLVVALFSVFLKAEPGFYDITDSSIPLKVREAARSVFSLQVKEGVAVYETVESLEWLIHSASKNLKVKEHARIAYANRCLSRDEPVPCEIPGLAGGSAVLFGDERILLTTAHTFLRSVNKFLEEEDSFPSFLEKIRGATLEFLLLDVPGDRRGAFLYSSSSKKGAGKSQVIFSGTSELTVPLLENEFFQERDLTLLELKSDLSEERTALTVSSESPSFSEEIFLIGYPVEADGRPNGKNATGKKLYITRGKRIEQKTMFRVEGRAGLFESEKFFDVDADACFQMSGGAAVNANGELVGIVGYGDRDNKMYIDSCENRPSKYVSIMKSEHILEAYRKYR